MASTTRDFCYVANVVQANLLAATTEDAAALEQVYNVAVGDRMSLDELYRILRDLIGERHADLSIPARSTRISGPAMSATPGGHRQSPPPPGLQPGMDRTRWTGRCIAVVRKIRRAESVER